MPIIGNKISTTFEWADLFKDAEFKKDFEEIVLPDYIQTCRWFAGKSSTILHVRIQYILPISQEYHTYFILIIETQFKEAFSHHYLLPLVFDPVDRLEEQSIPTICKLQTSSSDGFIYDALYSINFREYLFKNILNNHISEIEDSSLVFEKDRSFLLSSDTPISSYILKADQSNTAIIYNETYFFKWFRRMFPESNPDLEISKYLKSHDFTYTASYFGSISWLRKNKPPISIGLLQEKLVNDGDAWPWMLHHVHRFFQKIEQSNNQLFFNTPTVLFEALPPDTLSSELTHILTNSFIEQIILLGTRTAQMHLSLAGDTQLIDFAPVPFNPDYSVWLKNKVTYLFDLRIELLEKNRNKLRGLAREYAAIFLDKRNEVLEEIIGFDASKLTSMRTRVHGDYHLGQVLTRGGDFYILDFEGEPESTIRDRKVKQSPLKDVAGMLRSFHYAIYATLFDENKKWTLPQEEQFEIAENYYQLVCGLYLYGFVHTAQEGGLDIGYKPEIRYLLRYHLLEKAVYELGYELNSRPAWAIIPLRGILKIMGFNTH